MWRWIAFWDIFQFSYHHSHNGVNYWEIYNLVFFISFYGFWYFHLLFFWMWQFICNCGLDRSQCRAARGGMFDAMESNPARSSTRGCGTTLWVGIGWSVTTRNQTVIKKLTFGFNNKNLIDTIKHSIYILYMDWTFWYWTLNFHFILNNHLISIVYVCICVWKIINWLSVLSVYAFLPLGRSLGTDSVSFPHADLSFEWHDLTWPMTLTFRRYKP